MSADATVEGSIVGNLRLNISDWVAKLDEAEARARELGRTDPTVRVDVDSAAALSKLATVEAAAKAAGGVNVGSGGTGTRTAETNALSTAFGRLDAAMAALDAEQAVDNEQMRQSSLLALKETLNMEALAGAERKAAEAAIEKAAAEDADATATGKAATANKSNVTRMGLMVAAVAALVPMVAPLAGYAVGVSGALAGMGAAGVLAILGIKNAMKDATVEGQSYSAGLQTLKGDLNGLASTSANTMLAYFQQAVGRIDSAMPSLNGEIRTFSSQLGVVGNSVLRGVITGMQVLNPLFVAGGQYVERLAAGFASWTADGGLQKFVTYAENELPKVEDTLGTLANAVVHIVEATAPLGTVTLAILKAVGDTINGMDDKSLLNIAAGAGAGYLAFKAWGLLTPILTAVATSVGAVGVATDVALGPIGLVAAAVTALAAVFAVNAVAAKQATTATDDYTAALQQDNEIIGEHVRQQAAKALADAGAISAAKKLGISASLVTNATLGNGDAQKTLTARLKEVKDATDKAANGVYTEKLEKQFEAVKTVGDAVKKNSTAIKDGIQTNRDYTAALGPQKQAQDGMATALGITAQAYATMTQKENDATTASKSLKTALDLLNGKNLSAAEAQNAFDSALANSNAHLNAAGNQIDRATTSLDGMSAAAVANRGELLNQVQAAEGAATAFRDQGGSAADTKQKLIDMKKAIVDNAVAHGEDRDAVQAFIDKVYQIPATIPPTKIEVDAANALATIARVQASLAALSGNAVAVQAQVNRTGQTVASGHATVYKAAGGMVEAAYLASGGSPFVPKGTDTKAAMLTPGEFVVKAPSAQAYPGFMQAYNDNPTRALQAVQASGSQPVYLTVNVTNKTGANLDDLIDFRIESKSTSKRVALSTGLQKVAF